MNQIRNLTLLGALLMGASAASASTVEVHVNGVASTKGKVLVAVCDEASFLKKCTFNGSADARNGEVVVPVKSVPAGTWAVTVFHDENGDGRLDRNQLGIPTEGYGFSHDATAKYGPPQFSAASLTVGETTVVARVNLQY